MGLLKVKTLKWDQKGQRAKKAVKRAVLEHLEWKEEEERERMVNEQWVAKCKRLLAERKKKKEK